jgi:hypothetical protein
MKEKIRMLFDIFYIKDVFKGLSKQEIIVAVIGGSLSALLLGISILYIVNALPIDNNYKLSGLGIIGLLFLLLGNIISKKMK